MNYYEHHIGDYAEATGHLSILEDGIYSRLIRKYYATEKPLPADVKDVQRLICARSPGERAAVQAVLREFFELRDDGWHNERCDEEIVRYLEAEPERETRRTNEALRMKRHREERAGLFGALHAAGQAPAWNTSTAALRELHGRYCGTPATGPATPETRTNAGPATGPATPETRTNAGPATGPATPETATHSQSPFSSPHSQSEDPPKPPAGGGLNGHAAVREKSPERQRKDSSRGAWVKAEIARKANDFEGLKQREPLVAEAIRLIGGFLAIGMTNTDRMGTVRARFRETFEQLLERKARE